MKRAIILMLALAAAQVGGKLQAQQPQPYVAPVRPAAAKIGVVNLLEVFDKCEKYKKLKADLEIERAPYVKEKEDIEKIVEQWQKVLRNKDTKQELREQGYEVLKVAKRRREDVDYRLGTEVAKHQEEKVKAMIIEFNTRIEEYAVKNGYHLVIGYGDLPDGKAQFATANATDKGFIRPMVFPGMPAAIDLTQAMLVWLNRP